MYENTGKMSLFLHPHLYDSTFSHCIRIKKVEVDNIMALLLFMLIWTIPPISCRKSDYKKLVFSEEVEKKLNDNFISQVRELNYTKSEENTLIKRIYEVYLDQFKNYRLSRIQPKNVSICFS